MQNKELNIQPVISEKAYAMANAKNTYVFYVPATAEKIEIAKAVEAQYKVKVEKVNTVTKPGKMRRNWSTYTLHRKSDQKKAYVTLKDGDKIEGIFG